MSNWKARTKTKIIAFILEISGRSVGLGIASGEQEATHSITEKRYPMQALLPPENARLFPQIPGIDWMASGGFSQRSGLKVSESPPVSSKR